MQGSLKYLQGQATSQSVASPAAFGQVVLLFVLALVGLVLAACAHALAFGTLVFRWRVVDNTIRFVGLLFVVAYFAVPALALANATLWFSGVSARTPFFQPTISSVVAQILFLVSGRRYAVSAWNLLTGADEDTDEDV